MLLTIAGLQLCLVALLLLLRCASANGASICTDRPIIGILTQPTTDDLAQYGKSMLHAGKRYTAPSATCLLNNAQDIPPFRICEMGGGFGNACSSHSI